MNIKISNKENKILLDILYNHDLCKSGCYMDYPDGTNCGTLKNNGEYKCELQNIVNGLLNKLGESL